MEEELYHYDVKGMKWSVRRNPSKVFRRVSEKADRLKSDSIAAERKSKKANVKSTEASAAYAKADYKTYKKGTNASSRSLKKLNELEGQNAKATFNVAKAEYKEAKADQKFNNWRRNMERTFSKVSVNDISSDAIEVGHNYLDMLLRD